MKLLNILFVLAWLSCAHASSAPAPEKPGHKLTCCEKAAAEKKECKHKCCITAHKDGKSCEKCNPNKEDLKLKKPKSEPKASK